MCALLLLVDTVIAVLVRVRPLVCGPGWPYDFALVLLSAILLQHEQENEPSEAPDRRLDDPFWCVCTNGILGSLWRSGRHSFGPQHGTIIARAAFASSPTAGNMGHDRRRDRPRRKS